MKIAYKDIILRDYEERDIADNIRWMTEEIAWQEWDAPWEIEEDLNNFDFKEFYENAMKRLKNKKDDNELRWKFEIDTKEGVHIGGVTSYLNDKEFKWKPASEGGCLHTIGIDICESSYWGKGYGTQAFTAFIKYYLSKGIMDIYTETWSGNYPMIALADKVGFEECHRERNFQVVKGNSCDGITFKLNINKFKDFLSKYE